VAAVSDNIRVISDAFTSARAQGGAVKTFPGVLPASLEEAYAVQDRSMALWPDTVAGWKIGLIAPALRTEIGAERLAGPIFARQTFIHGPGKHHDMPVFEGGFAAIEAEFVFRLKSGLANGVPVTPEAAAGIVEAMHIGVEIASSPFAGINDLGPMSVVSDFGNNNGLIVGPQIEHWQDKALEALPARVEIDGRTIGEASAAAIPGGPIAALCFLIELCRARAIELKAGDYVSTGAVTGVHEAPVGAESTADFGPFGSIPLRLVAASSALAQKASA
jgi:2-keto-4-pentenoate hydratase